MHNEHKIPPTIDNQLEGMRRGHAADLRRNPAASQDGSPDPISAVEQVQATWAPGAPETAFGAVPPENDDETITV